MKKAVYLGPRILEVMDDEIPTIGSDEALLRVKDCTICGTDLRIYNFGHFKIPRNVKRVLGHEVVGEIAEVGNQVQGLKPGARVAIAPNVGCGRCDMCVQGWNQLCPDYEAFGISLDGGFEEYMKITAPAIRQGNVLAIPDDVSYLEAVLAEPLSCVYNGFEAIAVRPGDTVVIFGAGPIGLLHVQLAKLGGAVKVILCEPIEERLWEGKRYGADVLVNPEKDDIEGVVRLETGGKGADAVITAASVARIQQQALEVAGVLGRINFFGGLPGGQEVTPLNTNLIHYKQLKVTGTTGSNHRQYRKAMELIAAHKIDVRSLIGKVYPLEAIREAFELGSTGKKIAISFEE